MNYGNMHFEFARNAGKQWLAEQMAQAESVVPLEQMINVVENYILMKTGQHIKIRLRQSITVIPGQISTSEYYHNDLQLLGRIYDIAIGKAYGTR